MMINFSLFEFGVEYYPEMFVTSCIWDSHFNDDDDDNNSNTENKI